jgi:hypothetical protein
MYKQLPMFRPMKNQYMNSYQPGGTDSICNVQVIYKHPLDILDSTMPRGINKLVNNKDMPVVVQAIGNEFTGSNIEAAEGIRDQPYLLRTNFAASFKQFNPFPLKDTECAYMQLICTIRDNMYNALTYDKLYSFSLISAVPICTPDMLDEERMSCADLLKSLQIIEGVFQTAIIGGHKTIILSLFGLDDEDANPLEDLILLYNYCIFKYGHKFTNIIIGVPSYAPEGIYEMLNEQIVKPQILTKCVDEQYEIATFQAKALSR